MIVQYNLGTVFFTKFHRNEEICLSCCLFAPLFLGYLYVKYRNVPIMVIHIQL